MLHIFADPFLIEGAQSGAAGIVAFLITWIVLLFGVPYSIKASGSAVAQAREALSKVGHQLTEAVKGNPNDPGSLRNKTRRNLIGGMHNARANVIRQGDKDTASAWQRFRGRVAGNRFLPDAEARVSSMNKDATAVREQKTSNGRDDEVYAGSGFRVGRGTTVTPEMASTLRDYGGGRFTAGSTLGEAMNFDSKGRRITDNLYERGRRLHAGTNNDVAEGVGYAFGKAQNDRERSAARMAFAQNALQRNWSQTEVDTQWAKAVYGKKDTDVTQWYSKPTLETVGGNRQVRFKDVGDDMSAYSAMTEELNQSRSSYAITSERDGAHRVMFQRQQELEAKAATGSLDQQEHKELVKTYQIFDAVSQRMATQQTDTAGNIVSAQGTPESQAVIKAAIEARKLKMSDYDPADGSRTFTDASGAVIGITGGPRPAVSDAASRPNVARIVTRA